MAIFLRNNELDERFSRRAFQPAGAAQQFEIVILLVRGDFTGMGNRYGFCEQKAAAIAGVSDAFWNSGPPGKPCRLESVLKQERGIKFLRAKFVHEIAFVAHEYHAVANLLIFVDGGDVRARENGNLRIRKARPYGTQRRQGQDGVTNPIRGANEDFHPGTLRGACSCLSRAAMNSLSAVKTKSIAAMKMGIAVSVDSPRFSASFSVVTKAVAPAHCASFSNRRTSAGLYR